MTKGRLWRSTRIYEGCEFPILLQESRLAYNEGNIEAALEAALPMALVSGESTSPLSLSLLLSWPSLLGLRMRLQLRPLLPRFLLPRFLLSRLRRPLPRLRRQRQRPRR